MPFFNSNTPSKIFYSSAGSEILRLTGVTFIMLVNKLLSKKSTRRSQKTDIVILQSEMPGRHFEVLNKSVATATGYTF